MQIWMAILGALIGWVYGDFSEIGFFGGGLLGLAAGWSFRRAIRNEVATATAGLRDEIVDLHAILSQRRGDVAGTDASIDRPVAAASARRAVEPSTVTPKLEPASEPEATSVPALAAPSIVDASRAAPPSPGWLSTQVAYGMTAARNWLFGGNTIVRLGLVILFVGLSFLASYAAAAGLFPIELRLAVVGAFGIALLGVGYRTRMARPDFALALQGGGVGVIYLTLFGASRLYDLVPLAAAFALMIAVCALGCALALLQRSQALAVTAFAGGFAVPLLLGGEGGNAFGLFGYGTILNLAILFIARARTWRALNLVGFVATFGIAGLWSAGAYRPDHFVLAQVFLVISVLIYVAIAMLYTRATPGRLGNAVDTTLVFGPALAGFGLEVALVGDRPFGSAFAALAFAALYLGVTAVLMRQRRDGLRLMHEAMLAIGIGFVTMAVPLALGTRWTSAAWALEGAGAFWVGMRQARWVPRLFGLLLQVVATLLYLVALDDNVAALPLVNPAFVGAMLVAFGWFATAWLAREPLAAGETSLAPAYAWGERRIGAPAFLLGFALAFIGWLMEATRLYPAVERSMPPVPVFSTTVQILLVMLAYIVGAAAFQLLAQRRRWPIAAWPARVGVGALWLGFLAQIMRGDTVLSTPGWMLWIVAIVVHGWTLRRSERDRDAPGAAWVTGASHVAGVWLAVAIAADMLRVGIDRAELWSTAWSEVTLLAAAVLALGALTLWTAPALRAGGTGSRWPLDRHAVRYGWIAAAPLALMAYAGALGVALFSSGDADPLPFVPLVNPVDVVVALAVAVLLAWRRAMLTGTIPAAAALLGHRRWWIAIALLGFAAANGAWLRTAHHLAGVAWGADSLLGSSLVETGIAILWTVIALTLMVVAHRRGERRLWLAGAGLLGATIVKLLVVDLNATGGGARIVAFIAVGVLMLLVGYLAPLPPRDAQGEEGAIA